MLELSGATVGDGGTAVADSVGGKVAVSRLSITAAVVIDGGGEVTSGGTVSPAQAVSERTSINKANMKRFMYDPSEYDDGRNKSLLLSIIYTRLASKRRLNGAPSYEALNSLVDIPARR